MKKLLAVFSAALLLSSCGTRGSLYTGKLQPLPLVNTPIGVVQIVPQTQRAIVVTPGDAQPGAISISKNAKLASAVPNTTLVAILAGTAKAPLMDLVNVADGAVETFTPPGFFDAIHWSPEGSYGVLTYVAGAGTGTLAARNLNEVALFDVAARSLVRLQLDTESLAPRGVLFGPDEPSRRLVAVALERGVAVFDAKHPEVAPRRISLRAQGDTAETSVLEALFSEDASWLFVRASGIDDVVTVELGDEVGAPVSASINFVAGGRGLTDIAPMPGGIRDAVLAVYAASREVFALDARGIQDNTRRLALPDALSRVDLLDGARVLLSDPRTRTVVAWDINDGRSGTAVLDGTSGGPIVLPRLSKAIFPHPLVTTSTGSGPSLSIVTVEDATNRLRTRIQAIQLARPMNSYALDSFAQRLFFSGAPGSAVVTLDLVSHELVEVSLNGAPQTLHYVSEGDWVAAEHSGNPFGDVTFVPAGTSDRALARHFSDFALTDALDRSEDAP